MVRNKPWAVMAREQAIRRIAAKNLKLLASKSEHQGTTAASNAASSGK